MLVKRENYFLTLLYKKVVELKNLLNSIEDKDYSQEYKKYLISGCIITLNTILEIGIGTMHSSKIDELSTLIYYTRQKAVHYGYFNGLHDIEESARKIISLVEENYDFEKIYYKNLIDLDKYFKSVNIVIKNSPQVMCDTYFYKFKSKDGKSALCVPLRKVFTLTARNKEKVNKFIIDTSSPLSLYFYSDEKLSDYTELHDGDINKFFIDNYTVVGENFVDHINTIENIIYRFSNDPLNAIQIMEYSSNSQFCYNTIDVISNFILEKTMFEAYIEGNYLIKDKYSLSKIQKTDYVKLKKIFSRQILPYLNQKDAFFIGMTIKRFRFYTDSLRNFTMDFNVDQRALVTILVQLFETGPKYFSNRFINSSETFKKCYNNLLKYRQIFSHYLLKNKEYNDAINEFKNEFYSFIHILQMIDLDDVRNAIPESYDTYKIIERKKSDFFNYKHEQYLKLDSHTYIGKKIYYSSHNSLSDTLIAIFPMERGLKNVTYYEKDANDYLTLKYNIDEKTGNRAICHSREDEEEMEEVQIDFNLSNIFKAYSLLRKYKRGGIIQIYFQGCEKNNYYPHYDDLENVVLRFFNQGYLPIELLQITKLRTSDVSRGVIKLLDENDCVIADIISNKKRCIKRTYGKDNKNFFSRIDDITHDFSKRRHKQ